MIFWLISSVSFFIFEVLQLIFSKSSFWFSYSFKRSANKFLQDNTSLCKNLICEMESLMPRRRAVNILELMSPWQSVNSLVNSLSDSSKFLIWLSFSNNFKCYSLTSFLINSIYCVDNALFLFFFETLISSISLRNPSICFCYLICIFLMSSFKYYLSLVNRSFSWVVLCLICSLSFSELLMISSCFACKSDISFWVEAIIYCISSSNTLRFSLNCLSSSSLVNLYLALMWRLDSFIWLILASDRMYSLLSDLDLTLSIKE